MLAVIVDVHALLRSRAPRLVTVLQHPAELSAQQFCSCSHLCSTRSFNPRHCNHLWSNYVQAVELYMQLCIYRDLYMIYISTAEVCNQRFKRTVQAAFVLQHCTRIIMLSGCSLMSRRGPAADATTWPVSNKRAAAAGCVAAAEASA